MTPYIKSNENPSYRFFLPMLKLPGLTLTLTPTERCRVGRSEGSYLHLGPFNIRYVLFCAQGINMIFVLFCTVLVKMCTILYRFSQNLYYFVPFLIILYPKTPKNFALRAYPARKMIYSYTYLMLKGPIW